MDRQAFTWYGYQALADAITARPERLFLLSLVMEYILNTFNITENLVDPRDGFWYSTPFSAGTTILAD
jgi:hypothetical protein